MEQAMTEVIDSGAFATVGGFTVALDIRPLPRRFALQPVSFFALGGTQLAALGGGAAQLTSPTNGQYLAQAMVAEPPDSAVGYWLPQAGNGFVSAPLVRLEPFVIPAPSLQDFIDDAAQQVGINFTPATRTRGSATVL